MANEHLVEEDYIEMDINSTTFLCYTLPSPPHAREFEFQMSSNHLMREQNNITSPADELFYKGKLLPLHLPPRLEMVEKLLQTSTTPSHSKSLDSFSSILTTNTSTSTPFESCNISPATSCYVSGELHPEDYFECTKDLIEESHTRKSWSKKLNLIKHSSIGLKLKASKAYLKSLFTKSGCSEETSAVPKARECPNGYLKRGKKNPFGQTQRASSFMKRNCNGEKTNVKEECGHRRSFSTTFKRRSSNKFSSVSSASCSSSSKSSSFSSVNSNEMDAPQMLKRSSSVSSDKECSIQGAIAYCKKSQQAQLVCGRKSVSDIEFYLLSGSRTDHVECEKQER